MPMQSSLSVIAIRCQDEFLVFSDFANDNEILETKRYNWSKADYNGMSECSRYRLCYQQT